MDLEDLKTFIETEFTKSPKENAQNGLANKNRQSGEENSYIQEQIHTLFFGNICKQKSFQKKVPKFFNSSKKQSANTCEFNCSYCGYARTILFDLNENPIIIKFGKVVSSLYFRKCKVCKTINPCFTITEEFMKGNKAFLRKRVLPHEIAEKICVTFQQQMFNRLMEINARKQLKASKILLKSKKTFNNFTDARGNTDLLERQSKLGLHKKVEFLNNNLNSGGSGLRKSEDFGIFVISHSTVNKNDSRNTLRRQKKEIIEKNFLGVTEMERRSQKNRKQKDSFILGHAKEINDNNKFTTDYTQFWVDPYKKGLPFSQHVSFLDQEREDNEKIKLGAIMYFNPPLGEPILSVEQEKCARTLGQAFLQLDSHCFKSLPWSVNGIRLGLNSFSYLCIYCNKLVAYDNKGFTDQQNKNSFNKVVGRVIKGKDDDTLEVNKSEKRFIEDDRLKVYSIENIFLPKRTINERTVVLYKMETLPIDTKISLLRKACTSVTKLNEIEANYFYCVCQKNIKTAFEKYFNILNGNDIRKLIGYYNDLELCKDKENQQVN